MLNPLLGGKDFQGRIPMGFCHTRETARLALAVFVPISRAMSRHERPEVPRSASFAASTILRGLPSVFPVARAENCRI